ncbi:hypothetical protein DAPPUDRAFT_234541 [Daphnia pulex]|uniref:cGMP-dependent protein kinase interacting domain-containing protein n=1 Tax=Daphnia pulex TaxID=6669 RepID=E9FWV3_DAPPU|nr:hypothetical protein DAPPUDRAFT_234541 [Daphnia pulex]|eukprot:EFX87961.1 hypothetical protein DAPPUDRAFT_234541 [Daphnia pulex]
MISGRIPSSLSGLGSGSSYSSSRYSGIRSSSSVPYGSSSPSYSTPLSSSTLSALALSTTTSSYSRYVPSSKSAYSPASSASSSPRLSSSFYPGGSSSSGNSGGSGGGGHFPTRSRSFNRGSDVGYGSWSNVTMGNSLSDRGSSSRQVSRPSSLGSSISDVRDEAPAANTQPSTPITTQQQPTMAAAAAAVASGAMTPNGDIDYKKLWEESQVENERLRDRLRSTHEELAKCKDQLDNAFQVSNARNAMTEAEKRERRALERKLSEMEEELKQLQKLKAENEKLKAENRALTRESQKMVELLRSDIGKMRDENGALIRVISKLSKSEGCEKGGAAEAEKLMTCLLIFSTVIRPQTSSTSAPVVSLSPGLKDETAPMSCHPDGSIVMLFDGHVFHRRAPSFCQPARSRPSDKVYKNKRQYPRIFRASQQQANKINEFKLGKVN